MDLASLLQYGLWTAIVFWIIAPIINKLFKQQEKMIESVNVSMKEWLKWIKDAFSSHDEADRSDMKYLIETIANWNNKILANIWKTKLDNNKIIDLAKNKVWFASENKLAFIKWRLEKNALFDRKDMIKKHIKTEMISRSSEYVIYLNNFTCSFWLVWDYVSDNFPMNHFLEEVYDVVFRNEDSSDESVLQKIQDIRFIMLSYQNDLFEQMKKDLNK